MLSGGHAPTAHGHHHGVAADAARDRVETHGMHPNPSPLMATKLNAATASAPPPRVRGPLLGLDAHTTRPQGPSRPTTPAGRLHHPSPRTIQTHPTGPTRAHPVPKDHPDPPRQPDACTTSPQGPSRPGSGRSAAPDGPKCRLPCRRGARLGAAVAALNQLPMDAQHLRPGVAKQLAGDPYH